MIQSTFLHLPRVGKTTEEKLWKNGVQSWEQFLERPKIKGFSKDKKLQCDTFILESQRALHRGESTFFLNLPSTAHWRLWEHFQDECLYVDIETNWHHDITVLGIFDGLQVKQFIKGQNLTKDAVRAHLRGKLFVTYNGASFDLPVIKRFFGDVIEPTPHFDIRHLASRLGYAGGLKALEQSLGMARPEHVAGMSGHDALHLWDLYRASGDETYLKRLLAYNEEDIVNLQAIARRLVADAKVSLLQ